MTHTAAPRTSEAERFHINQNDMLVDWEF